MGESLAINKRTATSLVEATAAEDYSKFCPDVSRVYSLNDLVPLKVESTAARVFRERVYFSMALLLKDGRWKDITKHVLRCVACGNNTEIDISNGSTENITDIEVCGNCGSDTIYIDPIIAFNTLDDFKKWMSSELNVTSRTVLMRLEYINNLESVGVTVERAFDALSRWGIAWLVLTRQIVAKVKQEAMPLEEAQRILNKPSAFTDTSMIVRYTKVLQKKESIYKYSIPNSPDFVLQVLSPEGEIKAQMLYVGVPIGTDNMTRIDVRNLWKTNFGLFLARSLGVQVGITYDTNIDMVESSFGFNETWRLKQMFINTVRQLLFNGLVKNWNGLRIVLVEADVKQAFKNTNFASPHSLIRLMATIYNKYGSKFSKSTLSGVLAQEELNEEDYDIDIIVDESDFTDAS